MAIEPFPGKLEKAVVDRPYITRGGRRATQHVIAWNLTDAQREWLIRYFPVTENSVLMEMSGLNLSMLHRYARLFHLRKTAAAIHKIRKRQAARTKKMLRENGYYDSIRGRKPSDNCRKAVAQMWQDIRDGKREHPIAITRRTNPRRYRLATQHRSESRKELIRREQQRIDYGLRRHTKIVLRANKYTRRQTSHRYYALKKGYILMADCSEEGGERYNIYYDDSTQRSQKLEASLIADGFTLLPLEE